MFDFLIFSDKQNINLDMPLCVSCEKDLEVNVLKTCNEYNLRETELFIIVRWCYE